MDKLHCIHLSDTINEVKELNMLTMLQFRSVTLMKLSQFTYFLAYVKEKLPHIKHITYFSDGCAGQYKNCKNFLNLCHHQADFGFSAEWHFFATSHGKGPCDGLGGTIKRLATKASLQRCTEGMHSEQILSPTAFFEFCCQNIKNIEFVFTTYSTTIMTRNPICSQADTQKL